MANICDTSYKCIGSKKDLKALYNAIKYNDDLKEPLVKNGFGTLWIGCVITKLGGNWEDYRCRGEIVYYDYDEDNNILTIDQLTAWCEQEGFREFIEERFPSVKVYFLEEEIGYGVYNTNDRDGRFFDERYRLELESETLYLKTIEEVAEILSEETGKDVQPEMKSIINAVEDYNDEHSEDDEYINLLELSYS